MKRTFIVLSLFVAAALAGAQQPQQPPKTLAEANLIIAQDRAQMAEMQLRISELEAAFTSQISAARQKEAEEVQAAQQAVNAEAQAAAAQKAAAKGAPTTEKDEAAKAAALAAKAAKH